MSGTIQVEASSRHRAPSSEILEEVLQAVRHVNRPVMAPRKNRWCSKSSYAYYRCLPSPHLDPSTSDLSMRPAQLGREARVAFERIVGEERYLERDILSEALEYLALSCYKTRRFREATRYDRKNLEALSKLKSS